MPIVNYLHTVVISRYWNREQWQSWADGLILCKDNLEDWIYKVAFANDREELFLSIAYEKIIEVFHKETFYWEPDVVIGYYYLMYQEGRMSLSELFTKLMDEDDVSGEAEFFDSQEAVCMLSKVRKGELNAEEIDKLLKPLAKIARKQLDELEHYHPC